MWNQPRIPVNHSLNRNTSQSAIARTDGHRALRNRVAAVLESSTTLSGYGVVQGRSSQRAGAYARDPADVEVRMQGIHKRFGGTNALKGVDYNLQGGEVSVLLGENGAGKSTLVKILAGVHRPDSGRIVIDGAEQYIKNPAVARGLGIVTIFQEFSLFHDLTVAENVHLPHLPRGGLRRVNRRQLIHTALVTLEKIGADIDPLAPVFSLTVAERQLVEIARSMVVNARVVIMDEPTAALSAKETERLFNTIRRLRQDGVGVLYISHRLEEVKEIADRITVFRDGRVAGEVKASEATVADMVRMMVGREVSISARDRTVDYMNQPVALEITGFGRPPYFQDVDLAVHAGETVGIAGLAGSGSIELAHALFGDRPATAGRATMNGAPVNLSSVGRCISNHIGFISEDRANDGLVLGASVKENLTLVNLRAFSKLGCLRRRLEKTKANELIEALRIVLASPEADANSLSGGNQQKLVVAKWLSGALKVLVIAEPTRGVDIGARQEIYALLEKLKTKGVGIVLVSSDIQELVQCSDRVCVMRRGRIAFHISGKQITRERLLEETLRNV